jgi:hypothetical protein
LDIGGGVPPIGIKVTRSYMWYLKSYTSNVIPIFGNVHKKYKIQASTIYPNASLCINEKHTFLWKLMTKGERLYEVMKD